MSLVAEVTLSRCRDASVRAGHFGRQTAVAVVECDDPKALRDQFIDETLWPTCELAT